MPQIQTHEDIHDEAIQNLGNENGASHLEVPELYHDTDCTRYYSYPRESANQFHIQATSGTIRSSTKTRRDFADFGNESTGIHGDTTWGTLHTLGLSVPSSTGNQLVSFTLANYYAFRG
jgi:hypothetical protein